MTKVVLHFFFIACFLGGIQGVLNAQPEAVACIPDTTEYEPPRFSEREQERHRLVEQQLEPEGISDSAVLEAMKQVPRHLFVPANLQSYAYENRALPIGHQQTISQPFVVAYMTQLLELEYGDKVLEIGTGSGYQAAILSEITPCVFTIEIVEPLGKDAIKRFNELGYQIIKTKIGDGYEGWEEFAPYDGIILTAAPEEIPQPLIDQLRSGGILIAPVGTDIQFLTKVTKNEQGEVSVERKIPVRFVPMTGKQQGKN